jgi:DNA-binding NarL/FixJ family response regulator
MPAERRGRVLIVSDQDDAVEAIRARASHDVDIVVARDSESAQHPIASPAPIHGAIVHRDAMVVVPALRRRRPGVPVLMVSRVFSRAAANRAVQMGTSYTTLPLEPVCVERILEHANVAAILDGLVDPNLLGAVRTALDLTPRQGVVLGLRLVGFQRKEVAKRLAISVDTVDEHFEKIKLKAHVHHVDEIVRRYHRGEPLCLDRLE